jgi:1-acyl-sn-glycerol-3-phosphate acyltransferase
MPRAATPDSPIVDPRSARAGEAAPGAVPDISRWWLHWFLWTIRRYLARHLRAVRLLEGAAPRVVPEAPLMVYLNHAAWWDPLVALFLAYELLPGRLHYGPIDGAALGKYRFFARLGFFGLDLSSFEGARTFLRVGRGVLARHDAALWVTAEGRFTDVRTRPVVLRPGIAHLAAGQSRGVVLPLAIEYPFWTERTAEVLCAFGDPIEIAAHPGLRPAAWTTLLAERLAVTQDRLAAAACRREPAEFRTLLGGSAGVGGVYDLWRRSVARFRGEPFSAAHSDSPGESPP